MCSLKKHFDSCFMPCSNQSIQKYFYLFYQEQYSEDTLLKAVEIIIEVLHTKHLPVP